MGHSRSYFRWVTGALQGEKLLSSPWHEHCLRPCEQQTYWSWSKSEPRTLPIKSTKDWRIEKGRRREDGQKETGIIKGISEPTVGRAAEQSCSAWDRHGHFLVCARSSLRRARLGITDDFTEIAYCEKNESAIGLGLTRTARLGAMTYILLPPQPRPAEFETRIFSIP